MIDWIVKKIILTFILIAIVFTLFLTVPWTLIHAGAWFMPRPPTPEIIRGEFPFRIEYKMDGEMFIIENVFIAEFNGFGWDAGRGRHRLWKGWVKSTASSTVYIPITSYKRLDISIGEPSFYMNDLDTRRHNIPFPQFLVTTFNTSIDENSLKTLTLMKIESRYSTRATRRNFTNDLEFLYEEYGILILNYQFSEPVVNSFR